MEDKKVILNPVLSAPWKAKEEVMESPTRFISQEENPREKGRKDKKTENSHLRGIKRKQMMEQNIAKLTKRFPGLKKTHAKAALLVSSQQMDKAMVLLEVSSCYRRESGYLRKAHIDLIYEPLQAGDPVKLISFKSFFSRDNEGELINLSQDKVGVFLVKNGEEYKANML